MEKYPLFDRRGGTLIRNFYCTECMCGPFTQDDVDKTLIIQLGSEKHPLMYCRKCLTSKFPQFIKNILELSEEDKEREKYILSGDALNDLKNNSKTKNTSIKKEEKAIVKKVLKSLPEPEIESEEELIESLIVGNEVIEEIIEPIMDITELADTLPKEPQEDPKGDPQGDSGKEIDFSTMSARKIVNLVKKITGKEITVSLKSKKMIIDQAEKILNGQPIESKSKKSVTDNIEPKKSVIDQIMIKEPIVEQAVPKEPPIEQVTFKEPHVEQVIPKEAISEVPIEKNEFSNMSAREIVKLVKEKTGQEITVCLKSKIVVIKYARRILAEKGIVL